MKPPIQAGILAIAVIGLSLTGCRQQSQDGVALTARPGAVSRGLLRAPDLEPGRAGWEYGRRDAELGSVPGSIPAFREQSEIRMYDRQYTSNGRVREYSRTITRSIRRSP